jgi:predicted nucleic acid-binding protein
MAKPPTRIAVDLTVLIDLAANDATTIAGIEAARQYFKPSVEFVVSPVTRQALALAVTSPTFDAEINSLAYAALQRLETVWKFVSPDIDEASLGVCEENAKRLISAGLLGGHAWNSAHTIAEAACLHCSTLLAHDEELLEVNPARLKEELKAMDRGNLWITTPGNLSRESRRT